MSEEKNIAVPEKFKALVEQIENLSVLELSELVKVLEDKFGVSAAAPVAVTAVAGVAGAAAQQEEKTSFDVELTSVGGNKIAVIKVVKEAAGIGLADAKALVDSAPKVVKAGLKKEEAEELRKKLTDAGAIVSLK